MSQFINNEKSKKLVIHSKNMLSEICWLCFEQFIDGCFLDGHFLILNKKKRISSHFGNFE